MLHLWASVNLIHDFKQIIILLIINNLIPKGDSSLFGDQKRDSRPFFRTNATLAIPHIIMHPALDEVQQALNRAVQNILSVSGAVAQWSKEWKKIVKPGKI